MIVNKSNLDAVGEKLLVISNAQKFVLNIPEISEEDGAEDISFIKDWQGNPIGNNGILFENGIDNTTQAVPTDGKSVIIFNQVTKEQAEWLHEKFSSINKNFVVEAKKILKEAYAIGIIDRYNSDIDFIEKNMTKVNGTHLHKRDSRDICEAYICKENGVLESSNKGILCENPKFIEEIVKYINAHHAHALSIDEIKDRVREKFSDIPEFISGQPFKAGDVILVQAEDIRKIDSEVFKQTYTYADGVEITENKQTKGGALWEVDGLYYRLSRDKVSKLLSLYDVEDIENGVVNIEEDVERFNFKAGRLKDERERLRKEELFGQGGVFKNTVLQLETETVKINSKMNPTSFVSNFSLRESGFVSDVVNLYKQQKKVELEIKAPLLNNTTNDSSMFGLYFSDAEKSALKSDFFDFLRKMEKCRGHNENGTFVDMDLVREFAFSKNISSTAIESYSLKNLKQLNMSLQDYPQFELHSETKSVLQSPEFFKESKDGLSSAVIFVSPQKFVNTCIKFSCDVSVDSVKLDEAKMAYNGDFVVDMPILDYLTKSEKSQFFPLSQKGIENVMAGIELGIKEIPVAVRFKTDKLLSSLNISNGVRDEDIMHEIFIAENKDFFRTVLDSHSALELEKQANKEHEVNTEVNTEANHDSFPTMKV